MCCQKIAVCYFMFCVFSVMLPTLNFEYVAPCHCTLHQLGVGSSFALHPTAVRLHCNSRYCCYTTCYIFDHNFLDKIRIVTFTETYTVRNLERHCSTAIDPICLWTLKVKVIRQTFAEYLCSSIGQFLFRFPVGSIFVAAFVSAIALTLRCLLIIVVVHIIHSITLTHSLWLQQPF